MKIKHFVRQSLFFSTVFLASLAHLAEGPGASRALAEQLSDIEAHQFKIMPLEKSQSGRVYRFKTEIEELPHTGNIVLVQDAGKPVMAFRVLKSNSEIGEFIGKRVRRYDTLGELKLNEAYISVEKLADMVTPPPPETALYDPNAKPELDPNPHKNIPSSPGSEKPELDPLPNVPSPPTQAPNSGANGAPNAKKLEVEGYDDDLDSSTSPQNLKRGGDEGVTVTHDEKSTGVDESEDMTEAKSDLEVSETPILNPYKYTFGISLGTFRNMSNFAVANPTIHNGFTAYFSHLLDRGVFVQGKRPQDSLNLEYGLIYYTQLNADPPYDGYNIMPLRADLRYDLNLSESFSLIAFLGLQYNLILSTQNVASTASDSNYSRMHGFQPNFGAGFLYNIGPQWYLRLDLGLDRMMAGLAVKW